MMKSRLFIALLLGSIVLLVTPIVKASEEKIFNVELKDGKLLGANTLRVKHNDKVGLKIKSNEDGALHLHAYQIEIPVTASVVTEYFFVAKASGRFKFEWHPTLQIRTNPDVGRHESLAVLEVYPQ